MPDISLSNEPMDTTNFVTKQMLDTDPLFIANSNDLLPTQEAVNTSIKSNRRKGWVNGQMVNGITPYVQSATTNASGQATLWLTDNGTSTGNAVFQTIYADGIIIIAYGSGNNYQVYNPVISADKKSITVSVNQQGAVILGLISMTSAAAGVTVRGIILGSM